MYYVDYVASFTLQQLTQGIRDEEQLFSESQNCCVCQAPEQLSRVGYEKRDTRPTKQVTLVLKGEPKPAGTTLIWSGKVFVEQMEREVEAYR